VVTDILCILCSVVKINAIFQAVYLCVPCEGDSERRSLSSKVLRLLSSPRMLSVSDAAEPVN
jgi:hypothetical protein